MMHTKMSDYWAWQLRLQGGHCQQFEKLSADSWRLVAIGCSVHIRTSLWISICLTAALMGHSLQHLCSDRMGSNDGADVPRASWVCSHRTGRRQARTVQFGDTRAHAHDTQTKWRMGWQKWNAHTSFHGSKVRCPTFWRQLTVVTSCCHLMWRHPSSGADQWCGTSSQVAHHPVSPNRSLPFHYPLGRGHNHESWAPSLGHCRSGWLRTLKAQQGTEKAGTSK